MKWLYLLHLDTLFSHTQHYAGITRHVLRRVARHQAGMGSTYTREAIKAGHTFKLAALWQVNTEDSYAAEKLLKSKKHHALYCPICNPGTKLRLPGCKSYPLPQEDNT